METRDNVWKSEQLGQRFLDGVRGAIPLANEQIAIMLRVLRGMRPRVRTFLDVGCGDGVLGRAVLAEFPGAKGVFLDFSEFMIEQAKAKVPAGDKHEFIVTDYGQSGWVQSLGGLKPFDAVISGFSIHHQPDERKRKVYGEIYDLLNPGGVFLNLEHVASASSAGEKMFDELFIDALQDFHRGVENHKSRDEIAKEYYHRPDKAANILASVEDQCRWLREIGYKHVDCFMKVFELALFGGRRPRNI